MITTETPYKLAEIIRMTWPQLYNSPQKMYNESKGEHNSINAPFILTVNNPK